MVCVVNGCYHWGSRSPDTACVSAPASRVGGGAPGLWQYDRRREAAAGAMALVSRQWNPPPNVAENNNMTIRRIYKKVKQSRQTRVYRGYIRPKTGTMQFGPRRLRVRLLIHTYKFLLLAPNGPGIPVLGRGLYFSNLVQIDRT